MIIPYKRDLTKLKQKLAIAQKQSEQHHIEEKKLMAVLNKKYPRRNDVYTLEEEIKLHVPAEYTWYIVVSEGNEKFMALKLKRDTTETSIGRVIYKDYESRVFIHNRNIVCPLEWVSKFNLQQIKCRAPNKVQYEVNIVSGDATNSYNKVEVKVVE